MKEIKVENKDCSGERILMGQSLIGIHDTVKKIEAKTDQAVTKQQEISTDLKVRDEVKKSDEKKFKVFLTVLMFVLPVIFRAVEWAFTQAVKHQ